MELTNIRDLFRDKEMYLDKEISVGGWVRSVRGSKTFGFIVVNDGTFFEPLQVVYGDHLENFAEISKLNVGAAIIVTGKLVATPDAKQPFEIQASKVELEGASTPDYPMQKKRHSLEYLRTVPHLRLLVDRSCQCSCVGYRRPDRYICVAQIYTHQQRLNYLSEKADTLACLSGFYL